MDLGVVQGVHKKRRKKIKRDTVKIFRFHGIKISPQYDPPDYLRINLPDLPQYHLPELRGRRGRRGKDLGIANYLKAL